MIIGFANGCFDRLHDGHRHFLRECSMKCHLLVVGVNSDESIRRLKGAGRPFDNLEERLKNLRNFSRQLPVNVSLIPFGGVESLLLTAIRPDIQFRGYDQAIVGKAFRSVGWKEGTIGPRIIQVGLLKGFSTTSMAMERKL